MRLRERFDWRLATLFGLLGPAIGTMLFLLASSLNFGVSPAAWLSLNPANWASVMFFLVFGYLFGIIPAIVTALLLPSIIELAPAPLRRRFMWHVAIAAISGFVISWLLFSALTPFRAITLPILGGASAIICTACANWFKVGPNNSFKPNPLRGSA